MPMRTAIDVARANGVAVATVRKRGALLGGHKVFGRWRFPAAEVRQPNGSISKADRTLRELSEEISRLATISVQRDNRLHTRLEAIEQRLKKIESYGLT